MIFEHMNCCDMWIFGSVIKITVILHELKGQFDVMVSYGGPPIHIFTLLYRFMFLIFR